MTDTLGDLTSALQTYVVAPLNAFGLGGLVFDVEGEDKAVLTADITDHYTESNQALQDHIAIRPKRITLRGFVGELVATQPGTAPSTLQSVTQKLTEINGFLPQISAAATQAQAAISGVGSAGVTQQTFSSLVPATANIFGIVQNAIGAFGNMAKQQGAYQYFASCLSQGILMGIQTPWEFLTNMAIEAIEAIQPDDSIFISEFSITFKQIRIATTSTVTASSALSGTGGVAAPGGVTGQGANAIQGAAPTNLGSNPSASLPDPSLPGAQASIVSVANIANSGLSNIFKYQ